MTTKNEIKVGDCFKVPQLSNSVICVMSMDCGGVWAVWATEDSLMASDLSDFYFDDAVRITPEEFRSEFESAFAAIKSEVEEVLKGE